MDGGEEEPFLKMKKCCCCPLPLLLLSVLPMRRRFFARGDICQLSSHLLFSFGGGTSSLPPPRHSVASLPSLPVQIRASRSSQGRAEDGRAHFVPRFWPTAPTPIPPTSDQQHRHRREAGNYVLHASMNMMEFERGYTIDKNVAWK